MFIRWCQRRTKNSIYNQVLNKRERQYKNVGNVIYTSVNQGNSEKCNKTGAYLINSNGLTISQKRCTYYARLNSNLFGREKTIKQVLYE